MADYIDEAPPTPIVDPDALDAPSPEPLSEYEINQFFDVIDSDRDGYIDSFDLKSKFQEVYNQVSQEPDSDVEKGVDILEKGRDEVSLPQLIPDYGSKLDRPTFTKLAQQWNIPSYSQTIAEKKDQDGTPEQYELRLPWRRRLNAYWSVEGPKILSLLFVTALQLAFGIWQGVRFIKDPQVRAALGWGVIMAKFAAGALYPTLFFVYLSMSRWFSTRMRRFKRLSRFVGWDHQQAFHILMTCEAFLFAVIHSIGHLAGSFAYGSRPAQQDNIRVIFGPNTTAMSYGDYIALTPGWTGITALGAFIIMAICSMPIIRRRSYELFQLSHLLMYPFGAMLCIHGTDALLGRPALGYVIAFPLTLVFLERIYRFARGFIKIRARMTIVDESTVTITCKFEKSTSWRKKGGRFTFLQLPSMSRWFHAGQYIFLQVPAISRWQWHPFTISMCKDEQFQVHIKCESPSSWTRRLRDLPEGQDIYVGLDGPFGAPAQRFYNYDRSVIIGAGIGVTPFSAILADLEHKVRGNKDDPFQSRRSTRQPSVVPDARLCLTPFSPLSMSPVEQRSIAPKSERVSPAASISDGKGNTIISPVHLPPVKGNDYPEPVAATPRSTAGLLSPSSLTEKYPSTPLGPRPPVSRRVDFIWSVRERKDLLWFQPLLNRVHDLAACAAPALQIKARLHVTARQDDISTHVFRHLLDRSQSKQQGLKIQTNFGRPNLTAILRDFHQDMRKEGFGGQVGVFFCGNASIGRILSDCCRELTARAQADGSKVRYVFMMETFG